MKRILTIALSLISCLHATIHVVASQKTFELLAKEIGQEQVQVHLLSPSAQGSHLFQLLPSDNQEMQAADLVIASAALEPVLKNYSKKVIAAHLHHHHHHEHEHGSCSHHHALNHEWLSLKYTKQLAKVVASRLAALDESHASLYKSRAQALSDQLSAIQEKYKSKATVSGVFYHQSFDHLANECKLLLGPALFSCEESQISIHVLQDIQKNNGQYKTLFAELNDPTDSVHKVAQQIGLPITLLDTQGIQAQDLNTFFETLLSKLTQEN